jgi:glycosyltransferase involved in cell wall biosynthesis
MSSAQPMISVVIPSYNHAHLIGRALASVLAQNWQQFEIILVDNHSSDNTDDVVASFKDDRIRLIKVRNDGVIAVSRNVGVRAAKGEWIAFLDSDDWWTPNKLAKCAQHFEKWDLIYHRMRIVVPARRNLWPRYISRQLTRPVLRCLLISGNPVATSSVVMRRVLLERVGGFDERKEIVAAEDYDIWLRIAKLTDRFSFERANLGYYLLSMQSASRKDMSRPIRQVQTAHAQYLLPKERERMDANAAYTAGRYAWSRGELTYARLELLKSLRYGRADVRLKSLITLLMLVFKQFAALIPLGKFR